MNRQEMITLFNSMHPNFFEREYIRALPEGEIFSEMLLPLAEFDGSGYERKADGVSFGFYEGDPDALKRAVAAVDEDWAQYFNDSSRTFCGYVNGKLASFCNIDDMGEHFVGGRTVRVGGPGCVGTLPEYRNMGIGLTMVKIATQIFKDRGYDISYIHFTAVDRWYAKLGYKTVLQWTRNGVI